MFEKLQIQMWFNINGASIIFRFKKLKCLTYTTWHSQLNSILWFMTITLVKMKNYSQLINVLFNQKKMSIQVDCLFFIFIFFIFSIVCMKLLMELAHNCMQFLFFFNIGREKLELELWYFQWTRRFANIFNICSMKLIEVNQSCYTCKCEFLKYKSIY